MLLALWELGKLIARRRAAASRASRRRRPVPNRQDGLTCSAGCRGWPTVRSYRRQWLAKDVVAGVVLTTLLVPQGMAYAELAGLPPITGLYTSIMCLLGYAVFGPSRILVLGPDPRSGR